MNTASPWLLSHQIVKEQTDRLSDQPELLQRAAYFASVIGLLRARLFWSGVWIPAMTYFRGSSHYHRRQSFHGRVRDGNGWDRQTMFTGNTGTWRQETGAGVPQGVPPVIDRGLNAVRRYIKKVMLRRYANNLILWPISDSRWLSGLKLITDG